MRQWRTDIENAPRGREVRIVKIVNGAKKGRRHIEREFVWLASKCGIVTKSYWVWPIRRGRFGTCSSVPRWCMFATHERPIAWRPFIEGEFPEVELEDGTVVYPNGREPEFPDHLLEAA
ncbi:hypothetical protein [Pseudohoeflea coraliihabitans]|uniref:Uncharacterized protein n=1 Tax=Pseudohoeflea coraliihabitans TaxID=2860393 RepID=A0ABS6WP12_9HYPH|nr:hypothetical protein [Pseudohoeflea sp. DP4N28-3]MBW3096840.1 hypothetical protein [Pseudohoeflea sp. DP4N28-3]